MLVPFMITLHFGPCQSLLDTSDLRFISPYSPQKLHSLDDLRFISPYILHKLHSLDDLRFISPYILQKLHSLDTDISISHTWSNEKQKYHTVGTVSKYNRTIDTPNTQTHDPHCPGLVQTLL
jgi:hypothetical protein